MTILRFYFSVGKCLPLSVRLSTCHLPLPTLNLPLDLVKCCSLVAAVAVAVAVAVVFASELVSK